LFPLALPRLRSQRILRDRKQEGIFIMTNSLNNLLRFKCSMALVSTSLFFCLSVNANAAELNPQPLPPKAWYISASGTLSLLKDTSGMIANAPVAGSTVRTESSFKNGFGGQVAIGHIFGPYRLEGEIGYTRNKQNHYVAVVPPTGRIPADVKDDATRVMINGYYKWPWPGPGCVVCKPDLYLGAGIGASRVNINFVAPRAPFPTEAPRQLIKDSDTRFAYQLMAGTAVPVSDKVALTLQYRWFDAGTVEGKDVRGEAFTRDHAGSNIDVGVRVRF
jgi:OmpA-OmpF porin, OOP family